MADEDELKEAVKAAIKDKDGEAALELLVSDNTHEIAKQDRNRLADLAIKGAYVAPHFTRIFGLLSGDVLKRLSEDTGRYAEENVLLEALENPDARGQREMLVRAAMLNKKIGIHKLYVAVMSSVSNEIKADLNLALGRSVDVSNEDLAAILGDTEFSAQRDAILSHVEARMDADDLEEFLEEVRATLTDTQVLRLEQAIVRKRKYQ